MAIPVHRGAADLVRTLLNPRLLMVYVLLGGSAIRGWRQRQWRRRLRDRRERYREARSERGDEPRGEGTDDE